MTSDPQSFDPYRSPSLPEGPYAGPPATGSRSGWLTALCVVCIVFGALGLFNSLFGTFGLIAGRQFQQMVMKSQAQTPGIPPNVREAQEKMQTALMATQDKYVWALGAGLVVRFVASGLLLIGGIGALSQRAWGRKVLMAGCAFAVPLVIGDTILQSLIAMENMTIINSYMEGIMNAEQGKEVPPNVEGFVRGMFGAVKIGSIIVLTLIALAKLALYSFGFVYLQRPDIRSRFQSPVAAAT